MKADRELLKAELQQAMKIDHTRSKTDALFMSVVGGLGVIARHACNLHDRLCDLVETNHSDSKARTDRLEQRLSALTKRMNAMEKR